MISSSESNDPHGDRPCSHATCAPSPSLAQRPTVLGCLGHDRIGAGARPAARPASHRPHMASCRPQSSVSHESSPPVCTGPGSRWRHAVSRCRCYTTRSGGSTQDHFLSMFDSCEAVVQEPFACPAFAGNTEASRHQCHCHAQYREHQLACAWRLHVPLIGETKAERDCKECSACGG